MKNYLRDLKNIIETKSEESETLNKEDEFQKTRGETYNFAFQISKGMAYLEGLKVGVSEREYFSEYKKNINCRLFTETWQPEIFYWLSRGKFAKSQISECLETCTWTRPTPRWAQGSCRSSGWPRRVSRTRSTPPSRMSGATGSCSGSWTLWAPCPTRVSGQCLWSIYLRVECESNLFSFQARISTEFVPDWLQDGETKRMSRFNVSLDSFGKFKITNITILLLDISSCWSVGTSVPTGDLISNK